MSKIKLLKIDELEDGTVRLQSQLLVGQNVADFIMKEGVLKHYKRGERGFGFYETSAPFEIVKNKEEMRCQPL